jgi:hypothetical protein
MNNLDCWWWQVHSSTSKTCVSCGYDPGLWWLALASNLQQRKGYMVQTNCHALTGGLTWSMLVRNISQIWNKIISFLFELPCNRSICFLSFIYLMNNSMQCVCNKRIYIKTQPEFIHVDHIFCSATFYSSATYVFKYVIVQFSLQYWTSFLLFRN